MIRHAVCSPYISTHVQPLPCHALHIFHGYTQVRALAKKLTRALPLFIVLRRGCHSKRDLYEYVSTFISQHNHVFVWPYSAKMGPGASMDALMDTVGPIYECTFTAVLIDLMHLQRPKNNSAQRPSVCNCFFSCTASRQSDAASGNFRRLQPIWAGVYDFALAVGWCPANVCVLTMSRLTLDVPAAVFGRMITARLTMLESTACTSSSECEITFMGFKQEQNVFT